MHMKNPIRLAAFALAFLLFALPDSPGADFAPTVGGEAEAQPSPRRNWPDGPAGVPTPSGVAGPTALAMLANRAARRTDVDSITANPTGGT